MPTTVSILLCSHNKPRYLIQAVESVLRQTHKHWELLLWDSGLLHDDGFFERASDFWSDPRIKIVKREETEEDRKGKDVVAMHYNRMLQQAQGSLITYLCDDDRLYVHALDTFAFCAEEHPEWQAMYASIDTGWVDHHGHETLWKGKERKATSIGGSFARGSPMRNRVDQLQICHRSHLPSGIQWPEDKKYFGGAGDGYFMESLGAVTPWHPINNLIGINRCCPFSMRVLQGKTDEEGRTL